MASETSARYHPQICLGCRDWMRISDARHDARVVCPTCGYDNSEFADFYALCAELDEGLHDSRYRAAIIDTRLSDLRSGPTGELLAIISAYVLGLLTNASYDLIKQWILGRRASFDEQRIAHFDFERVAEPLIEYVIDNIDKIREFRCEDDQIQIRFQNQIESLKNEIGAERKSTNEDTTETKNAE